MGKQKHWRTEAEKHNKDELRRLRVEEPWRTKVKHQGRKFKSTPEKNIGFPSLLYIKLAIHSRLISDPLFIKDAVSIMGLEPCIA